MSITGSEWVSGHFFFRSFQQRIRIALRFQFLWAYILSKRRVDECNWLTFTNSFMTPQKQKILTASWSANVGVPVVWGTASFTFWGGPSASYPSLKNLFFFLIRKNNYFFIGLIVSRSKFTFYPWKIFILTLQYLKN